MRSLQVRLGLALIGAGIVAALIAAALLVEKRFLAFEISFGVAVLLIFDGAMLVGLAGTPAERKARQAQMDRWSAALGMARGGASGGWTPRKHDRKPPQRRNRAE